MRGGKTLQALLMLMAVVLFAGCAQSKSVSKPAQSAPGEYGPPAAPEAAADSGGIFGGLFDGDADGADDMRPEPARTLAERGAKADRGETSPAPQKAAKKKPAPSRHDGTTTPQDVKKNSPLLIYTANYTMAVYEVTQSIDNVQALAKKMGGYLVRRNDREITIRIPTAKYRNALSGISKLGDVLHHEETVEDVTEQFFDMMTRLDNARAMRLRLQELLAASKDVKEALAVEKELSRVTETIERMEGKLKRLRELINFSTITVTFSSRGGENVGSGVDLPFYWLNELGLGRLLQL